MSMKELLRQKIKDADMVLVGIGEEWRIKGEDWKDNPLYKQVVGEGHLDRELLPFWQKYMIEEQPGEEVRTRREGYECLAEILENKNYFIVTLCTDGLIRQGRLKSDRIVEPCGTMAKLQCAAKCTGDIYDFEDGWLRGFGNCCREQRWEQIKPLSCPKCGDRLVLNTTEAEAYAEEGYLPRWNVYTKWLQGTVNKRLCLLELGVGMQFPTVIRWPFEKIAFLNQKASFFRIHSKLYQTAEEIKDRSYGIRASSQEYLKELSKGF